MAPQDVAMNNLRGSILRLRGLHHKILMLVMKMILMVVMAIMITSM